MTPGTARAVSTQPSATISTAENAGAAAMTRAVRPLGRQRPLRARTADDRDAERGQRRGQSEAEDDDQQQSQHDLVLGGGAEQDDERRRAGNEPGGRAAAISARGFSDSGAWWWWPRR